MNYTEAESKVREATNEDPWGPTGPQMAEIAHMTYQYDAFPEVMSMLWKRMLQDNKNAWRRVYKARTFCDTFWYLRRNCSRIEQLCSRISKLGLIILGNKTWFYLLLFLIKLFIIFDILLLYAIVYYASP